VAPGVERVVLADADAVARRAAELVADAARRAAAERGRFVIALAGGTTPRAAYALLAGDASLPWAATHVWFGDERCVPPDDPDSNYRMAREALLARVPVPEAQVLRIEGERAPDDAAARYDALLAGEAARGADAGAPLFDLVLLGVGADGHTASLFPGTAALDERERRAVAVPPPQALGPHVPRVTLTFGALGSARAVVVLAAGPEKRDAAARALGGGPDAPPAGRVRGRERTVWLLDAAAGGAPG
jgi:6-phosphogluconolactonase